MGKEGYVMGEVSWWLWLFSGSLNDSGWWCHHHNELHTSVVPQPLKWILGFFWDLRLTCNSTKTNKGSVAHLFQAVLLGSSSLAKRGQFWIREIFGKFFQIFLKFWIRYFYVLMRTRPWFDLNQIVFSVLWF